MNKITKNILWGVILGSPVGVSFAANSAYMDKINQVTQGLNSSLHIKYDLPAISQYLSGGGGAAPSTPSTPSTSATPSGSPPSMPESSAPSDTTPSTSGGSWYVQPGDSGSSGSGSSGSSGGGFNYNNLY